MYEYSAISHVQQQQKMYSTYMYYNTVSQYNTNRKRITYSKVGNAADGLGLRPFKVKILPGIFGLTR